MLLFVVEDAVEDRLARANVDGSLIADEAADGWCVRGAFGLERLTRAKEDGGGSLFKFTGTDAVDSRASVGSFTKPPHAGKVVSIKSLTV